MVGDKDMKCLSNSIVFISAMVAFLSIGLCLSPILREKTVQADSPPTITTFAGYICYDGTNIWVANFADNNVTKFRVSDQTILGTYNVGTMPWRLCSDGNNIWVANSHSHNVTKLRASDGTSLGTYDVGYNHNGICYDGNNIWVARSGSQVSKLRVSDGTILGTYNVGSGPFGICSAGSSIWVANTSSHNVTKLRASDGTILGTYPVGSYPHYVCFDGVNIWVINAGSSNVMKLRVSDGGIIDTYANDGVVGICFDGANIWVVNAGSMTLTRLSTIPPSKPSPEVSKSSSDSSNESASQTPPNVLPIIIIVCFVALVVFLLIYYLQWRAKKRDELFERVCNAIRRYIPPKYSSLEIAYQWAIYEYLKHEFPNINIEPPTEDMDRLDIVIGHIGIEIKGPTKNKDLETLLIKCMKYGKYYQKLIFVLFAPEYQPSKFDQIKAEIRTRYPEITTKFIPISFHK